MSLRYDTCRETAAESARAARRPALVGDQAQDLVRVARLAPAGDLRYRQAQGDGLVAVVHGDDAAARHEAQPCGVDAGLVERERRIAAEAAAGEFEPRVVRLDAVADVGVDDPHL